MPTVHLQKTKKGLKSLCRLEIQILFTKLNFIKPVSSMMWLASDTKYNGYQRGLASMVCKSSASGVVAEPNYQLPNEPHR